MIVEVDPMESNGSALPVGRRHPVALTLALIFGAIAMALSVFYAYLIVTAISEWSGYVGHESGTATAILAVFGLITLLAWGATAVAIAAARAD